MKGFFKSNKRQCLKFLSHFLEIAKFTKYNTTRKLQGGIVEESEIKKALLKKALGFTCDEIVEEYSLDENGNPVLSKKKVTKKFNPPDISAMKMLLEKQDILNNDELSHMTDNELKKERKRLLKLLKEEEEGES